MSDSEYAPPSGSAPKITDDEILSLWRTVRPSAKQDAVMTYESGPYDVTCPTCELRRLVELAIEQAEMIKAEDAKGAELEKQGESLTRENDANAWKINPAMAQAKIDELSKQVEELIKALHRACMEPLEGIDCNTCINKECPLAGK